MPRYGVRRVLPAQHENTPMARKDADRLTAAGQMLLQSENKGRNVAKVR
jgi:hypothetical protein